MGTRLYPKTTNPEILERLAQVHPGTYARLTALQGRYSNLASQLPTDESAFLRRERLSYRLYKEVRRVEAPAASPGPGWTAITTAAGRGRDAYLRRGDQHGPTGSHPLLMVKHTDLAPNNERRAILSFDLAGIDRASLRSAKLALKLEPSGLGFSSLVPDSRFAVYGVTGEAVDLWSETDLTWETAGPLVGEPLSAETATRLAEFEVRKGSPNRLVEVSADAFVDFLRTHPGEIVSLMIVRETGESDQQGLVHAFASKEHPTATAPTLWLQTGVGDR